MQYTNKDYESIFDYLKEKATELSNGQWTDFTDGDFGTIIIHLLSYWGDLLSNQLDLTASELFIGTAEERTSLMEIVKLIGYEPNHYLSSTSFLNITYNSTETQEPHTIPAYTRFISTNNELSFYNLHDVLLSEKNTTIVVYEGNLISKNFIYSDIDDYGRIDLGDYYVGTNTVTVEVTSGSVMGILNRVNDVRFTTGELCYSVHTSLDGVPYIQLPVNWKSVITDPVSINVRYLQSNGSEGRIGANQITKSTDSTLNRDYEMTNLEASVGGYDPQTVAEIKTKASIFARTMYTCVTLKDFEDMSLYVDDIAQVKALDYNNKAEEFPPTISAYVQPEPPNGVPNDAYKVLIMAAPVDTATQTIFNEQPDGGPANYGDLTLAAKQLHELYWERKSATLYLEYRDPVYIDPWLIMNVYLDDDDLRISSISQSIIDYLRVMHNRNRTAIGESIYGSRIGKEILNNFPYVNYIEIRDPEYNIEAKPYEFIDIYNGYFQLFVNDSLKYVPKGLVLYKLKIGDSIRLKLTNEDDNSYVKSIDFAEKYVYDEDPTYIPNSYEYIWSKEEGVYPRLDLEKIAVSYEDDDKVMVLSVPEEMLNLGANQTYRMSDTDGKDFVHIYYNKGSINDIVSYEHAVNLQLPSYASAVTVLDEAGQVIAADLMFTSAYDAVFVKDYKLQPDQKITIITPNKEEYSWTYTVSASVSGPPNFHPALYYDLDTATYYIPSDWDVSIVDPNNGG